MDIVPDLTNHNDSKVFEYHYHETEILREYGGTRIEMQAEKKKEEMNASESKKGKKGKRCPRTPAPVPSPPET